VPAGLEWTLASGVPYHVPVPGSTFRLGGVYGNTVCMPLP
jgi:hypothetical protein